MAFGIWNTHKSRESRETVQYVLYYEQLYAFALLFELVGVQK
jgi:hypothetical protein